MLGCALAATAVASLAGLVLAQPVFAAEAWWHLDSASRPASIPAGGRGEIVLTVENIGDALSHGPVVVADTLPAGLRATGIAGGAPKRGGALGETVALTCASEQLSCETTQPLAPYDAIEVRIAVEALAGAKSGETNTVSVSGGGAPAAQSSQPISLGGGAAPFGVEAYELSAEGQGGGPVTQAGSHPFQATGTIDLDQGPETAPLTGSPQAGPAAPAKDVVAQLPPGLIADPGAVPRCLAWQFADGVAGGEQDECPYQSAVGVASVTFRKEGLGTVTLPAPVFDLEPQAGEPAQFGFFVPLVQAPVVLNTSVRGEAGEDWGVDLTAQNIPQDAGIVSARITFWGVPESTAHDDARGWGCLAETRGRGASAYEECVHVEVGNPLAFVTLPTSCSGPLASSLLVDSWSAPGAFASVVNTAPLAGMTGCSQVPFTPSIATTPTTHAASSPSGLRLDLNFDSSGLLGAEGIAQSDLEKTTISLPEGLTIDPSAGVGLGACTQAQYAEATLNSPPGAGCPEDSKLGTVEVETPLLFTTIYGSLYLATPYENPFKSLIALYVVARSRAERGIMVKLAGKVIANPVTGRLTVSFEGDPPLPFEHLGFHFREGAQAPLISPSTCGTYTTTAQMTPYTAPESALTDTASFQVTSGSEGTACPVGEPPFAPTIQAGTLTDHAGRFSPLYVTLARSDGMQEIGSYSTVLPVGLTADLTGVSKCPLADIEAARHKSGIEEEQHPSCPAASLIGHSLVGTGVGSILDYVPGALYLSGPFNGDPLSVVSITSAVVGPFDLGTVVIRFGLHIDPYTAQVSIDPNGSEPIPRIIDGIVVHVRAIRVSIDRTNFTLNPTSCNPRPISSTLTSVTGQKASTSTLLSAKNCNELAFKPHFAAATSARTSRARGASLHVKLTVPIKAGVDSNIRRVKVELPKQLPSELATLQHACTAAQFNANPAGCPARSIVGHAIAHTPILPEALKGPAIFVSHGGEEFPSLIIVLQGYGFTIDLVGSTHISEKTGVTSSTFKSIPDEPVGSFQLTLPEGKHPALAAPGGKLCDTQLKMPTTIVAQNGRQIKQRTPIAVDGCPKTIEIRSHRIKKHVLILKIYVPAAGNLKITGKHLKTITKKPNHRKTVTLKIHERRAGALKTRVSVLFTPHAGRTRKRQTKTLTVQFAR